MNILYSNILLEYSLFNLSDRQGTPIQENVKFQLTIDI